MSAMRGVEGDEPRRLLQLLAQTERRDLSWPAAEAWDWRPFAAACDAHQVLPYIYCRLQRLALADVPVDLLEHLRPRFQEVCARNYGLAKKLVDLTSMFQREGIPVLAFKGPSLAMAVYGGLALRQYHDLDLVIHQEHHWKAVHLMTGSGFQIEPLPALPLLRPFLGRPEDPRNSARTYEIVFRASDSTYYVDLHWQLGDLFWRALGPDVDKLWDRAERQDLPQGSVLTLCREDLFLALCVHGAKHRWGCLKWILDIAELLRKAGKMDWSRVEEMIRIRPGAGASASLALILANDLLDVPIPSEAGKILPAATRTLSLASAIRKELLLPGQTKGSEHTTLLALEARRVARMKYWAIRFITFPGDLFREVIVQVGPKDRDLIRLPQRLEFLYHFIRPARLIVKHCARVVRSLWPMAES